MAFRKTRDTVEHDQPAETEMEGEICEFVRRDVVTNLGCQPEKESEVVASNLNSLLQRVAGASVQEIDQLITELEEVARHAAERGRAGSARGRSIFDLDPSGSAVDQDNHRKPDTMEKAGAVRLTSFATGNYERLPAYGAREPACTHSRFLNQHHKNRVIIFSPPLPICFFIPLTRIGPTSIYANLNIRSARSGAFFLGPWPVPLCGLGRFHGRQRNRHEPRADGRRFLGRACSGFQSQHVDFCHHSRTLHGSLYTVSRSPRITKYREPVEKDSSVSSL
jgi:hypothetical protein